MTESINIKRATIKQSAEKFLEDNKDKKFLKFLSDHMPGSINPTQSGVTIKLKVEDLKQIVDWIEFLHLKSSTFKVELTIGEILSITKIETEDTLI